jgi:hypothetical protein
MLAHELEHVLEQIDGVDLAGEERRGNRRVWRTAGRAFETARAIDAADRVLREASAWRGESGVAAQASPRR